MSRKQRLRTLCIVLLTALLTVGVHAQRQVKVRPVLNKDKESNDILEHIADNFVLTIPQGRTLDSIENDICCTFRIGSEGQLQNFRIINQANAREMVELRAAPSLDIWIQLAILDGMKFVPPYPPRLRRNGRLHTIVFSFGLSRPDPTTMRQNLGFNTNGIARQIQDSFDNAQKELIEGNKAADKEWRDYTDTNIKESIRPKQEQTLPQLPTIDNKNPLRPPEGTPPTQQNQEQSQSSATSQQRHITIQLQ